jgi:hypothetical protein
MGDCAKHSVRTHSAATKQCFIRARSDDGWDDSDEDQDKHAGVGSKRRVRIRLLHKFGAAAVAPQLLPTGSLRPHSHCCAQACGASAPGTVAPPPARKRQAAARADLHDLSLIGVCVHM